MRKQSQMGASKYEFNPNKFDADVEYNHLRYAENHSFITTELKRLLEADPSRLRDTFSIMLDVMRDLKSKHDL